MIRKFLILKMLLLITIGIYAQGADKREMMKDKLKAQKVAFFTTELNLTAEESQKFWPVYNNYEEKLRTLKEESFGERKGMRKKELTESEAKKIVEDRFTFDENELALRREYVDEIKEVIPMTKVAKLLMLEKEFKNKMMDRIKKRFHERKERGDRRPNH